MVVAVEKAKEADKIETLVESVGRQVTGETNAPTRIELRRSPTRPNQLSALQQKVTLPAVQVAKHLQLLHQPTVDDLKFAR